MEETPAKAKHLLVVQVMYGVCSCSRVLLPSLKPIYFFLFILHEFRDQSYCHALPCVWPHECSIHSFIYCKNLSENIISCLVEFVEEEIPMVSSMTFLHNTKDNFWDWDYKQSYRSLVYKIKFSWFFNVIKVFFVL